MRNCLLREESLGEASECWYQDVIFTSRRSLNILHVFHALGLGDDTTEFMPQGRRLVRLVMARR